MPDHGKDEFWKDRAGMSVQPDNKQKFSKGDYIKIDEDLGKSMSHFQSGCEAIVIGSYKDQYGGSNIKSYTLHIKGGGQTSWYYEHQLTLIEANRLDLLEQWVADRKLDDDMKSDLDWIFEHGPEVLAGQHPASVPALANCFGLTNLWGSHGEGITYDHNARGTLWLAKPFLECGDRQGWLDYCVELRAMKWTF